MVDKTLVRRPIVINILIQECRIKKQGERKPEKCRLASCRVHVVLGGRGEARKKLYFVKSDPNMMRLYARFLPKELGVEDPWIGLYIGCHVDILDEIKRIEAYWTNLLQLPETCLRKTYTKKGSEHRRSTLTNGVCSIMVMKTELVHHIYGANQEHGGFENPDWLF